MHAHADQPDPERSAPDNSRRDAIILAILAGGSAGIYLTVALAGDLRAAPGRLWAAHVALCLLGAAGWWVVRRRPALVTWAIVAAAAFRLLAAPGAPTMSDDVYRYVWDGRVQLHGIHPYAHAPTDEALADLRDDDWESINHPELRTIYPPLAQAFFALVAATGAGPVGFKLALGLLDVVTVLALWALVRRLGLPADRVILYAWNPLAVLETAGSGHVEPLGTALIVLATACIIGRRPGPSTIALGAAVNVKLLPLILVPGWIRRLRGRHVLLLAAAIVLPALPYALTGPPVGSGLFDYAERWERNAVAFDVVRVALERVDSAAALEPAVAWARDAIGDGVPWDAVREWTWPDRLARLVVAALALAWIVRLTFRRGLDVSREAFLAVGGVLLLSPTLHPWYLLWVLPFAAAYASWPWLLLAALAPLAYATTGEVSWSVRLVEYGLPAALAVWLAARRRLGLPPGNAPG